MAWESTGLVARTVFKTAEAGAIRLVGSIPTLSRQYDRRTPLSWTPCSANDTFDDVVWLPRLLQKARRSNQTGTRLFDGYCYGRNDFIDARVLRFLNVSDEEVCACVRENSDDAEAARELVRRSGRSVIERKNFTRSMRRKFFNFALMEADEGRMQPGFKTRVICFAYNRIMMPAVYALFRRAEQKR